MARGNLSACLAVTLPHEGGYVDHPKDPGGATNMGITFATLKRWRRKPITKQDVRNLTLKEATQIYEQNFWKPINGELLPYGVDLATFDAGVNSGPSRGVKWLQRAAGVKQDGIVGPITLDATSSVSGQVIVQRLCGHRLSFVQGLSTFAVFGRGWSRRIADVEAKGVAMWLRNSAGMSAGKTANQLSRQGERANDDAGASGAGAAAGGAGGAGAAGFDWWSGGQNWLLLAGAVVLAVVAIGFIVKSRQHRERAEAYEREADEQALDALAGQ